MNQGLIDALNRQIANWGVLYVKLHNFHWYVTGKDFFTLHAKFEELYTEGATYFDELAERVLTLGGKPIASIQGYLQMASVKEAGGSETSEQMVAAIIEDFTKIVDELNNAIEMAETSGDEATADLLMGVKGTLEKHVWMYRAYLG